VHALLAEEEDEDNHPEASDTSTATGIVCSRVIDHEYF
jgi:hypothetical protein